MSESPPTVTVKTPLTMPPTLDLNGTVKVASPCWAGVRVSIGSTVKMQPVPVVVRATDVSRVVSMLVASPQVSV